MLAIYKKEIRSYFTSVIGYVFVGFFLAFIGLYHYLINMLQRSANFAYALNGVTMFFVLLVPMLTMRIMAEENRQKTDQLLFTSPISITKIIIGKYFALLSVFGIVMAATCFYPLVMQNYGTINLPAAYLSIFGFFMLGAAYMAIGLFISSLTESQAFAAVITFFVVLATCLVDGIVGLMPTDAMTAWITFAVIFIIISIVSYLMMHNVLVSGIIFFVTEVILAILYLVRPEVYDGSIAGVFSWFSIMARFDGFIIGMFRLADLIYYLSVVALFVFLTIQVIKKRRWN